MLRLLDANVLITANNSYYPIDMVPEFWDWLTYYGESGEVRMPIETFEEVTGGGRREDPLKAWLIEHKTAILLDEEVDPALVQRVIRRGYAPDLTDVELEEIGRDPFLIAYSLVRPADRCVVTTEVSAPAKQRANRKIPDVCGALGVISCNTFTMLRELNFSTGWRRG